MNVIALLLLLGSIVTVFTLCLKDEYFIVEGE